MTLRIALISPPTAWGDVSAMVEPLGLSYLSAVAKAAGHEVRVHDLVDIGHSDLGALFEALDEQSPEVVGFSALTNTYPRALALARAVKARYGCVVVMGGWHVSGEPESVLEPAIDYVVMGEGEETFLELLEHLEHRHGSPADIPGLAWKDGGSHRVNEGRKRLRKLTALPEPDRSDLPTHLYKFPMLFNVPMSKQRLFTIQASRGCPYKCTFCQTPAIWGNLWMSRDPSSVVDEIERLIDVHGANSLWFRDEEFTIRRRWVIAICEEMIRRGVHRHIDWGSFCRVDDIDRELATALKEAGYCYGFFGIESGDPDSREKMKKYYKQDEAERAIGLFDELDISSHAGWIVGFPWDTLEQVQRSARWIESLPLDMLSVMYPMPFSGTEFARDAEAQGLVRTRDFEEFTSRRPVLRSPLIPHDELVALRTKLIRHFYLRPRYLQRLARRIVRRPVRLRIFAEMAGTFAVTNGYFGFRRGRNGASGFEVADEFFRPVPAHPTYRGAPVEAGGSPLLASHDGALAQIPVHDPVEVL